MDLVNASCGRVNHCHSHTDSDASAIRRVMINKRDTLKGIKTEIAHLSGEIAQLVEKKSAIEKDLDLLGAVLKPACNHDLLPNEILGHVFILVVQDYGLVDFPMCPEFIAPPQLTISHVCSRWRRVALCTPELWSNTHLIYLRSNPKLNHVTWLHQRWLARAGTSPVSLSIYFDKCMNGYEIANTLQKIILPFRIKKLHLALTYQAFMYLATFSFSESALSDFMEVSLAVMIPSNELETASSGDINNPHFIPRLRSVKFLTSDSLAYWNPLDDWLDRNHQSLPWSQLRSMDVEDLPLDNLELLFNILHQIPMLQALKLGIYPSIHIDSFNKALTMPSLLDFSLALQVIEEMVDIDTDEVNLDKILRSFICPSLTKFQVYGCPSPYWTTETVEILKRQYNLQRLQKVKFPHGVAMPVSHLLRSAPMLRSFSIGRDAILDDDAIIGISNGSLAQRLRRFVLCCPCDIGEVLGMVEARKKTVDALIDNGCTTWREGITALRKVVAPGKCEDEYRERVRVLQEAGISITFEEYGPY